MAKITIEDQWKEFVETTLAPDIPPGTLADIKAAYYVSAVSVISTLMKEISIERLDKESMEYINTLLAEIDVYTHSMSITH